VVWSGLLVCSSRNGLEAKQNELVSCFVGEAWLGWKLGRQKRGMDGGSIKKERKKKKKRKKAK
jgi:hypothetical protein